MPFVMSHSRRASAFAKMPKRAKRAAFAKMEAKHKLRKKNDAGRRVIRTSDEGSKKIVNNAAKRYYRKHTSGKYHRAKAR